MKKFFAVPAFMLACSTAYADIASWFSGAKSSVTNSVTNTVVNSTKSTVTGYLGSAGTGYSSNGSTISLPGSTNAQPYSVTVPNTGDASADNCNILQQRLVQAQQRSLQARAPTTGPSHYINDVFNVNETLGTKIDVSGLFGAGGLNLGAIFGEFGSTFLGDTLRHAQGALSSRIGSIMSGYGASYQGLPSFGGWSGLSTTPLTGGINYSNQGTSNSAPTQNNMVIEMMQKRDASAPASGSTSNFFSR